MLPRLSRPPKPAPLAGAPPAGARGRAGWLLTCGAALALLAGCQNDEITKYKAPREDRPLNRILGAVIPHADTTPRPKDDDTPPRHKLWVVKLVGPQQAVGDQQKSFLEFVQSIHFDGLEAAWNLPKGWKQEAAKEEAKQFGGVATIDVGRNDLEMTVSAVPWNSDPGAIAANVSRWRKLLGLMGGFSDDVTLAFSQAKEVKLEGGDTATVVDLVGPGSGKRQAPPGRHVAANPVPRQGQGPAPLTYKTPPGWQELPAHDMRVAAFAVRDKDEHALVTVIPLGKLGLLANVNRWRGDLKLPPVTEAELGKDLHALQVDGTKAAYVDLTGPEQAGTRPRTLAVSLPRGEQTWYFKMHGPADLVGRQKSAFEAFVTSVHFPEGAER